MQRRERVREMYLAGTPSAVIHERVSAELGPVKIGTVYNLISSLRDEWRTALAAASDPLLNAAEFLARLASDRQLALDQGDVRAAHAISKDVALLLKVGVTAPTVPVELTMPLAEVDGDDLALLRLALEAALQTTGGDND